jgi:hypothetical protein
MFHTAYVVPDLEKAMEQLGRGLELKWTEPRVTHRVVHTAAGDQDMTFRVVFSYEGPPHVELIEAKAGTMFDGAEITVHHVGVWTDDVNAASARLAEQGLPWAAHMDSDTVRGRWRVAFNRNPYGGYVELLDVAELPRFNDRFTDQCTQRRTAQ